MVCWWYVKTLEEHSPFSLANSEWHVICPVYGVHSGRHCLRWTGQPYPRQDLLYNIVHVRLLYESTVSHRRQVINSQSQTFDVTIYGNCYQILWSCSPIYSFNILRDTACRSEDVSFRPLFQITGLSFFLFSMGPEFPIIVLILLFFFVFLLFYWSVRHF